MRFLQQLCLNPKVVVALIAIAIGVFVFAPDLVSRVIPLLLLAACPLSMLLMGGAMMRSHHQTNDARIPPQAAPLDEVASLQAEVESLRERALRTGASGESSDASSRAER